jgi:hypothetical protein
MGGRPSAVGDLPIRDQLDPYLRRLRRTVTFPTTSEEAYFGCMPVVVKRMAEEGMFIPGAKLSDRAQNLMQCLTSSTDGSQTKHNGKLNVVHVGTKTDDVFWMYTPENLPIPVYRMGTPFELPLDHPCYDKLTKWVDQCLKIEDGIQRVFAAIAKLEVQAKSGAEVTAAWPELLNFLKYRRIFPPLPAAHGRKLREGLMREISAEERRFVTEMLATCVMLPERNLPLTGWVNFYVEGL